MTKEEIAKEIAEKVLDSGELTKNDILAVYKVAEGDYPEIKKLVLKDPLVRPGPKHAGGFVIRSRRGKLEEGNNVGPTFLTDWENKTRDRLCELLQHKELEEVLGPIVQTVRQARNLATGEDRRGDKTELAAALVINHGIDLFRDGKIRELVGKRAGLKKTEVPQKMASGQRKCGNICGGHRLPFRAVRIANRFLSTRLRVS